MVLHMTTQSPMLRYICEKNSLSGGTEGSAALMLDWIKDMKEIDPVAHCAWMVLAQIYVV